jgi:hypothetical protein
MTEERYPDSDLFLGLVSQYQYLALIHLGKMVAPGAEKTERNLEAAKAMIDMLGMLESRTKGNLSSEEDRFLQQVVTNLRLNFIDESARPDESPEETEEPKGQDEQEKEEDAAGEPTDKSS